MPQLSSFKTCGMAAVVCLALYAVAIWHSRVHAQNTSSCPPSGGVWETRAPRPLQATEVGSAAILDKVYVLGGILPSGESSNRLFIYDAVMDTWSEGAPLPIEGGVNHPNVVAAAPAATTGVAFTPQLYMLGALFADGTPTGRSFVFAPNTSTWRELAPMPTPRGAAGIAARPGLMYVAGGLVRSTDSTVSSNAFEVYDPGANSWQQLQAMPTARDHLTAQFSCYGRAICTENAFLAIGGRQNGRLIGSVEWYSRPLGSFEWSVLTSVITARAGLGSAVVRLRPNSTSFYDTVYAMGGEGSATTAGTFPENESYTSFFGSFCTATPMPTPRHGFNAAAIQRVGADPPPIFAIAGGPRAGASFSDVNEVFFPPAEAQPTVGNGGVVNAATYRREIAGGSIVTMFGQNLTYRPVGQPRLPLPTQYNGSQVLVNGRPVPLLYSSPTQINFTLPAGTTSPATIAINKGGQDFPQQETVQVLGAAPGIFSADGTGSGQGAILHAGTAQLANAARPARAGDLLEIYLTGLLDCPLEQACIQVAPDVTIAGVPAPLLFYGRAPGFAGLNQINVRVPQGVAASATAPVVVSYAGRASNQVTIAVQ
jgi:uncharacterized protein (TIGR03437 family)